MTTATMALAELAEKGADVDVLRQMVQFMAQRLMELDVEGRCGAAYDEKNPVERLNSRNGYRGVHLISVQKVTHQPMSIGAGFALVALASPCRCTSFCYPSRGSVRRVNVGSISATGPCFACSL